MIRDNCEKTIFVVDGPSASGKTSLQKYVDAEMKNIRVINKYTDRPNKHRQAAGHVIYEQITLPPLDFDKKIIEDEFLWYKFGGYRYGFSLRALEREIYISNLFIIVRDLHITSRLKKISRKRNFNVSTIYIDSEINKRKRLLGDCGCDETQILWRLNRDISVYQETRAKLSIYDHIIKNSKELSDLFKEFQKIVDIYCE